MQFLIDNKIGVGIAAGVLILVAAYLAFFRGGNEALLESSTTVSPVSRELLVTLGDLRTVVLDDVVFTSQQFGSLVDFGVEIPLQPVGRTNPFEPLGGGKQGAR